MRHLTLAAAALLLAGCGRSDVPKEKYFGGEPVAHWLEAAKSPDAKVRKKAIDVLGNVGPVDPGAVPALIAALKDRDAKVRDAAVLGLSKIGPPAAAAAAELEALERDPDAEVRKHAAAAVRRVRG